MAVNISQAISAYGRAAKVPGAEATTPRAENGGESFANLLGDALRGAVQTGHHAEAMTAQAVAGKADLGEVVTAVTNAELTLQTVVAVRDRVVQAYQDIIRMPI